MKKYTLLLILLFSCLYGIGRADDPGFPGGDPDVPVPLDGGIGLLIMAGAFYGVKKIRKLKP